MYIGLICLARLGDNSPLGYIVLCTGLLAASKGRTLWNAAVASSSTWVYEPWIEQAAAVPWKLVCSCTLKAGPEYWWWVVFEYYSGIMTLNVLNIQWCWDGSPGVWVIGHVPRPREAQSAFLVSKSIALTFSGTFMAMEGCKISYSVSVTYTTCLSWTCASFCGYQQ